MRIYRNKGRSAYYLRFVTALAYFGDGLVRILSLGLLCTSWPLTAVKWQVMSACEQAKQERAKAQKN